jgi:hypothetical protein
MSRLLAAPVVDWGALGQVVLYSLAAGIGVAVCVSLAIFGAARFAEVRRSGGGGAGAFGYALLTLVGLGATFTAAVLAIVVMTRKG